MSWETAYLATSILLSVSEEDALATMSPRARTAAKGFLEDSQGKAAKARALATVLRKVTLDVDAVELPWLS